MLHSNGKMLIAHCFHAITQEPVDPEPSNQNLLKTTSGLLYIRTYLDSSRFFHFFHNYMYGEVDIRICVSQVTPRQYAHL